VGGHGGPVIKIVLIVAGFLLSVFYFKKLKSAMLDRLLVVVGFCAMVVVVINPGLTTEIAQNVFGIGRGTDLLLYLTVVFYMLLIMLIFSRVRANERHLTQLVRELAIHQAHEPDKSEKPSGEPR
jgi:hypothetical protein